MSCIWLEQSPRQWQARPLPTGRLLDGDELNTPGIALVEVPGGAGLLVHAGIRVRVNGESVPGGLRILNHRDELLVGRRRMIFSAQSAPSVVTFCLAEGQRTPVCAVCRGPIRTGMKSVACPGCGRWFHQLDAEADRPAKHCWGYATTCRFCQHPTALDAEAAWRPGDEDCD